MSLQSGKRALIVDDSKSARAFLTRLLEKHGLQVEAVEHAEQALEHLAHARPDVIFMDHMMPGMDGFQALQSIKHNPRTATIPIMMYTSQEGELYLSQARALGAMGVLPKQVKHAELATALYQLGLMPDRRRSDRAAGAFGVPTVTAATLPGGSAPATVEPEGASAVPAGALQDDTGPAAAPAPARAPLDADSLLLLRPMIESAVREQVGDLRRQLPALFADQSDRLLEDVRAAVAGASLGAPAALLPEPPARRSAGALPWAMAAAASIAALTFATLWWRDSGAVRGQVAQLAADRAVDNAPVAARARQPAVAASLPGAGDSPVVAPAAAAAGGAPNGVVPTTGFSVEAQPLAAASATELARSGTPMVRTVPYGETPLAGERLEALRSLLTDLGARGYRGLVTVTSYPGRFCLIGNLGSGYLLPKADAPAARCDTVGNPFDESLVPAQREPVALANLIGSVRQSTAGALRIELVNGEPTVEVAPYPPESERLTAGEWNRVAALNNRVEIRLSAAAP